MDFVELFRGKHRLFKIGAGEILFREGDSGTEMFVIVDGAANIFVGDTIVEVVRPGGVVGEMALVDDEKRSATVVTRTPCELVALSKADFDRLVHERPDFARYVLEIAVKRLRRMNQSLLATQRQPSQERGGQPEGPTSLSLDAAEVSAQNIRPGGRKR